MQTNPIDDTARDDGGVVLPWLGLILWIAATAAAAALSLRTPAPLPADAPARTGSAARALELIRRVAVEPGETLARPRRLGSEEGARARDRLVLECERLGLATEVQTTEVVAPRGGVAATVNNVVARLDGLGRGGGDRHAILLMAHHDSVAAGPGIGDDLAGCAAILEAVRALRTRGALQRDLIVLLTDGEEQGLLGAEAFASEHPFADEVGVVVNVEGRGAAGPSRMFETGRGNGWSIAALSEVSRTPSATSVSAEVYRRMPNGTDFTVWLERGIPGLNHAFIGDVHAYHTPLDGLDRLSPGSLQHHVDNVIDAVVALDRAPFPERGAHAANLDAVFLDVPYFGLVHASAAAARIAAGLALLLAAVCAGRVARRRGVRVVALGAFAALALLVATPAAGYGARLALGVLGAAPIAHPAEARFVWLGCLVTGVGGALLVLRLLVAARLGGGGALAGGALVLSGLAFAVSHTVVGATHLVLVPALALSFIGVLAGGGRFLLGFGALAGIVAAVAAGVVWGPLQVALVDALGTRSGAVLALPAAFGLVALAPALVAGRGAALSWMAGILIALGAAFGALAVLLDDASLQRPGRLSIVREETPDAARFRLEGPEANRERFRSALAEAAPGVDLQGHAPEPLLTGGPAVEILGPAEGSSRGDASGADTERGWRRVRLRVTPRPGATRVVVQGLGVREVMYGGRAIEGGRFEHATPPAGGFELDLVCTPDASVVVRDERSGLSGGELAAAARPLLDARPDTLVPYSRGDRSIAEVRVSLAPSEGEDPGADPGAGGRSEEGE